MSSTWCGIQISESFFFLGSGPKLFFLFFLLEFESEVVEIGTSKPQKTAEFLVIRSEGPPAVRWAP